MHATQLTTSAALYYSADSSDAISLVWLDRAVAWFTKHDLSPVLFTAGGEPLFELDDCYVLADDGDDLVMWDEPIAARRDELVDALARGSLHSLGLDSPRSGAVTRSDWRANADASSIDASFYLGIDEELCGDLVALMRRACAMAGDLFDVRYGIGYKMPLSEDPASYASGFESFTFADFRELVRQRHEGIRREKTPTNCGAKSCPSAADI